MGTRTRRLAAHFRIAVIAAAFGLGVYAAVSAIAYLVTAFRHYIG